MKVKKKSSITHQNLIFLMYRWCTSCLVGILLIMCLPSTAGSTAGSTATTTATAQPSSRAIDLYNRVPRGGAIVAGTERVWSGVLEYSRQMNWSKALLTIILGLVSCICLLVFWLYMTHYGFRRFVKFWKVAGPLAFEYKAIIWKLKYIDGIDLREMVDVNREKLVILKKYHEKAAPMAMKLALELGGIYIKIGQVMSTVGSGIFDPNYVQALQPLQNGIPPKSYEQISQIIESTTGKRMDDLFDFFEPTPIGSASVAQAHVATLKHSGEKVIVKVQYPLVAEMFHADLNNLVTLRKIVSSDKESGSDELIESIRRRHEMELDFRLEASNLRIIRKNMQRHGVEPSRIRIPIVKNETGICNQHVLAMEYLQGTPLSTILQREQVKYAQAILGKSFDPKNTTDIRAAFHKRIRHFLERDKDNDNQVGQLSIDDKNKPPSPLAIKMFRFYANLKYKWSNLKTTISGVFSNQPVQIGYNDHQQRHFNVMRLLKTLIYVHGLQMLKDGMYNVDPHPGNVLVLPDGRLGLLDYGMIGQLTDKDRLSMNELVHTLAKVKSHQSSKSDVAKLYNEYGYKIAFRNNNDMSELMSTEPNMNRILYRMATFHFDSVDLSPLKLQQHGKSIPAFYLLRNVRELNVPPWIEQGRRLTALLLGVAVQMAQPTISLAQEWNNIAKQTLRQEKGN